MGWDSGDQGGPPAAEGALDHRRLFHAVTVPCVVLDRELRIVDVNDAYLVVTRTTRAGILGRLIFEAFPGNPDDPAGDGTENLRASLLRVLATGRPDVMAVQRYDLAEPGAGFTPRYWSPEHVPILDDHGRTALILHQVHDITAYVEEAEAAGERTDGARASLFFRVRELERLNSELLHARNQLKQRRLRDPLTSLLVREVFMEELTRALHRQFRSGRPLAVLFVDLDRLKHVNDSFGHAAGDALLQCCAERLRASMRPFDVVARLGGDEFVALVEELQDAAHAATITERVMTALSQPCTLPGGIVERPVASIGVAIGEGRDAPAPAVASRPVRQAAEELLAHADAAMYRAKQGGRGRFELFDRAAYDALQGRRRLENELRTAMGADQLRVHYQPIIDLRTGATDAVEALLRWEHPTRGLLPAAEFIDLAEESGLIFDLGDWALGEACRYMASCDGDGTGTAPRRVFVNVSPAQVMRTPLPERVAEAARAAGVATSRIVLEVTESGVLHLAESAVAGGPLDAVRSLGVDLAIDDFGTGQSSLSRLVHLPTQILKIDKTFVRDMAHDRQAAAVVSAVLLLAHNLGKEVIAEGVEDDATLQTLRELGCTYAQGYHLGRPAPRHCPDVRGALDNAATPL